jgi:hypothetical protein
VVCGPGQADSGWIITGPIFHLAGRVPGVSVAAHWEQGDGPAYCYRWQNITVTDLTVGTVLSGTVTLCPNWPNQLTPKLTPANRVSPPPRSTGRGGGSAGVGVDQNGIGPVFLLQEAVSGQRSRQTDSRRLVIGPAICSAGGRQGSAGGAGFGRGKGPAVSDAQRCAITAHASEELCLIISRKRKG